MVFLPVVIAGKDFGAIFRRAFLEFTVRDRAGRVLWGSGRTMISVKDGLLAADCRPRTCVLHFNPYRSLFAKAKPDYYGAVTDAHIVYPWEYDRGADFASREPAMTS